MANEKKQIPLRISDGLYAELSRWASDDFRSLNGQIEYLLTECVKKRRSASVRERSEGRGSTCDFSVRSESD